jgi:hypothetical protein
MKYDYILVKCPLENNMYQVSVFNEMGFIEIPNVLAASDQMANNQKHIVLSNCYHRDDIVAQNDKFLSPRLDQTQALSDPRMTHNSSEKKLTHMIQVECAASIGEKGLTLKVELHLGSDCFEVVSRPRQNLSR